MIYKINIEETISQDFEIEATNEKEALELAQKLYKQCDLVLEPGNLLSVQFDVVDEQ